ncbi:tripartite tricarboxylate transporter substrate binding protein [Pigmentiphaga soli]|uniref:Tripartite tricarboxylate transporter substrate binding protein n=1 Tax=Pigmentiphaga soli TaxID=1007095 RepID=A0ABP8HPL1_9BURK
MRIALPVISALIVLAGLPQAAPAQGDFPSRPIRIVVPFLPGPAPDAVARIAGEALSQRVHQPVIVENRAGAGGTIGADYVAKSAPDGYTLFLATEAPLGISPATYGKLGYDPVKDFAPISLLATSGFYLVGCPKLPINDVAGLIALAKTRSVSYATSGVGSYHHLTGEMMKMRGGFDMVHVPYQGASAAMVDVMNCAVDVGFVAVGSVLPQIKSGTAKFKVLAVTTQRREPETPDIPTIQEAGIPGVDMEGYYGLLAPKGTPRPVLDKLSAELAEVMKTKKVIDRIEALGMHVVASTPQVFGERIRTDLDKFGTLAKEVNLHVQ